MEDIKKIKQAIITFLVLNFGLSSIFYYLMGSAGDVTAAGGLYVAVFMYCPAFAAIITSLIFYRSVRDFGWKPGKLKYLALGYALPLIIATISYGLFWLIVPGSFTGHFPKNMILFVSVNFFATIIAGVLGEEIGWRGFLVPHLAKITSFTKLALITGIIWALWHFPLIIFANYNAGAPLWYSLPVFTVNVIGISFILAWLRLKSGSIWPAVLFHACWNLFVQNMFDPLTQQTGITRYIIGETGMLVGALILITAFIFWMMRDKLPDNRIDTSAG
jgi:membrane protease YdiL (CAAX protease family)